MATLKRKVTRKIKAYTEALDASNKITPYRGDADSDFKRPVKKPPGKGKPTKQKRPRV